MKRALATLIVLSSAGFGPVQAGSFSVSPVRLELEQGTAATSLKVSNQGEAPELLQVTVLRWSRDHGEDQYSAKPDEVPIVTPPLFQLGPGDSQVVRLGFHTAPAPAPTERAWRVIVEEVPHPSPETGGKVAGNIAMRLRISVPLFLPPQSVHQDLRWEGVAGSGELRLVASNGGSVSERLDQLVAASVDGKQQFGRLNGPIYIFPGERRSLELKTAAPLKPGPIRLQILGTPRQLVTDLVLRAQ